jgi:hypothetical protein
MNEDRPEIEHQAPHEPETLDTSGLTESRLGEATYFSHRPVDP